MLKDQDKIKILSDNLFPVVGVGASAGGLDAFRILIRSIPVDSGMAYILVQHLHPEHNSSLAEILQRETEIPVHEITDNVRVEKDHVYIIPSNKLLVATDGILQLSPRPKNEKNMPIDIFFKSLAEVHQSHSIGVIMSGNGSDGTLGLKSIKDHGGITIAEDPSTAAYDSMPVSAIKEEVVDFILFPEKILEKLMQLQETLDKYSGNENEAKQITDEDAFKQILSQVRLRKGIDFTYYKQTTIRRRILRRMVIKKIEKLADYLDFLRKNKTEQDDLFQDLLIPVSSFMRDPKVFYAICNNVFPDILKEKNHVNPVRIWIAGCSTGQEAYSYGICLHEFLKDKISDIKIQIFATDLSSKAISQARLGAYSAKELEGLSEERLELFFNKIDGHYQIKKIIRDMFIFSTHNFLKDPPFGNLDLVSCRNVLIYLEPFLQKKALNTFHYGLKEKGILVLGKSETIGSNTDLFSPVVTNDKIYIKKITPRTFLTRGFDRSSAFAPSEEQQKVSKVVDGFHKYVDEILLARYTPPGVIINEQFDIVQFRGSTGNYLEPSPGRASLNVLKMAKEGLSFEIRNAIHKAKTEKTTIIKKGIPVRKLNIMVNVEVVPLLNMIDPHFLILFTESPKPSPQSEQNSYPAQNHEAQSRVQLLEKELVQIREDMRTITEEQEASNEELQSANEELLSGSEELQSLNEELETSKEELQSTNEELLSVNQELFERNEQYNQARLYAEGIITTIHEPLIVLDHHFKIKTVNDSFLKNFKLKEEDVYGANIFELQHGEWDNETFRKKLVKLKKDKIKFVEWEDSFHFSSIGSRILYLNAQPVSNEAYDQLILLAIEDVTVKREAEDQIKLFSQALESQVQERTASLKDINIELTHSNKNLEQFVSIASHDLQEPLRKIMTFAKLLEQRHGGATSPEAKDLLSKIVVSSERMSVLIKDVLSFSRMSDSDIAFSATDLNTVLSNVIKDFELLIFEKKAVIKFNNLPVIEGIPIQMNQLFYNLLSNSLKFSTAKVIPRITVTSHALTPDEIAKYPDLITGTVYHEIVFQDNGIGFDQAYANQIFLIFERLHNPNEFEGTGIGLALCERIVDTHHGLIRAEGKEGEGASFFIILPEKQIVHA